MISPNDRGGNAEKDLGTMKSGITLTLACVALLAFCSGRFAHADSIPASYGTATHATDYWQDISDVSWSIDGAAFGNDYTPLEVGQTLQFQVDMHKAHVGTHYADHIKAWLDLDGSGDFAGSDVILYAERLLDDHYTTLGTHLAATDTPVSYFSDVVTILPGHAGELWFRARVTCSESLIAESANGGGWDAQWLPFWTDPSGVKQNTRYERTFSPTGYYSQGDFVDIGLNVVPEPTTLALVGLGAVGLAVVRRRRRQSAA